MGAGGLCDETGFLMADTNTQRTLGRIEGKLEEIHADVNRHHNWMRSHEKRLRKVENRIFAIWGVGSLALVLVGAAKTLRWW